MEAKYHILSTALLHKDASGILSGYGIICDEVPFIKTKEALTDAARSFITAVVQEEKTIIFTSVKAVSAVLTCLNNVIPDWQIFCISGATKRAVADYFGADRILGTADDAIDLIKQIEQITPREIVFFCGNKRLDTLPVLLQERGFQVKECKVYTTQLTPVVLQQRYDAILFFSPSGVDSFLMENEIPERAVLFSIGKTTAKALQEKVNNELIVAVHPDKNILVQTVIDFYNKYKG